VKEIAVSLVTIFYVSGGGESCNIEFVHFVKFIRVVKARRVTLNGYAPRWGTWEIYIYIICVVRQNEIGDVMMYQYLK
jgi:hypothetical protein